MNEKTFEYLSADLMKELGETELRTEKSIEVDGKDHNATYTGQWLVGKDIR